MACGFQRTYQMHPQLLDKALFVASVPSLKRARTLAFPFCQIAARAFYLNRPGQFRSTLAPPSIESTLRAVTFPFSSPICSPNIALYFSVRADMWVRRSSRPVEARVLTRRLWAFFHARRRRARFSVVAFVPRVSAVEV